MLAVPRVRNFSHHYFFVFISFHSLRCRHFGSSSTWTHTCCVCHLIIQGKQQQQEQRQPEKQSVLNRDELQEIVSFRTYEVLLMLCSVLVVKKNIEKGRGSEKTEEQQRCWGICSNYVSQWKWWPPADFPTFTWDDYLKKRRQGEEMAQYVCNSCLPVLLELFQPRLRQLEKEYEEEKIHYLSYFPSCVRFPALGHSPSPSRPLDYPNKRGERDQLGFWGWI